MNKVIGGKSDRTERSEFFCHPQTCGSTALFDRQEVVLGKLIGSGTFCNVYQVRSIRLHETSEDMCLQWTRDCISQNATKRVGDSRYCIKFLQLRCMAHSEIFEQAASALHNELEIFQSCRHDNICAIRGVAEKGSEAYYCNGTYDSYFWIMDRMVETLEVRMNKWRRQDKTKRRLGILWRNCSSSYLADPSLADRMQTAYDMARAIEYLHRQRIVLRDVQPCNFGFAKENGPVQLFDANMARRLGEDNDELVNEDHEKLLRMHRYMAPELLWGDVYGPKADVYSFLSVFYELWTLKDLESDVKRRCTKNVAKIESRLRMSPDLEKLFPRGWSIRPGDRPSMTAVCATLRIALRQLQNGPFREEEDPPRPLVDTESSSSMSTSMRPEFPPQHFS